MRIAKILAPTILLLTLIACGAPPPAAPTLDEALVYTEAAQTVAAQFTQTSAALTAAAPTQTNTPESTPTETATFTPIATLPLFTLPAGNQETPTLSLLPPQATPTGPLCDNSVHIRDIGTPDGTVLKPGEAFPKGWLVQNTGTCDWGIGYRLVRVGGNTDFGGAFYVIRSPNQVVAAGAIAEISLNLVAPKTPGMYEAHYQLFTHLNIPFGTYLTVAVEVRK